MHTRWSWSRRRSDFLACRGDDFGVFFQPEHPTFHCRVPRRRLLHFSISTPCPRHDSPPVPRVPGSPRGPPGLGTPAVSDLSGPGISGESGGDCLGSKSWRAGRDGTTGTVWGGRRPTGPGSTPAMPGPCATGRQGRRRGTAPGCGPATPSLGRTPCGPCRTGPSGPPGSSTVCRVPPVAPTVSDSTAPGARDTHPTPVPGGPGGAPLGVRVRSPGAVGSFT